MAHNPIRSQQSLSRTDLSFNVPMGNMGVLYQGQRFVRLLQPGERPSVDERLNLGGLLVYLIDTGPHELKWRASFAAKGDKDFFNATIDLKYQVADPKRMAEERVTDTEALLTRYLEPTLRSITRATPFNQHVKADADMEAAIQNADTVGRCGLRLMEPPSVVINLTEEDHRRIKELNNMERAQRVALPAEHSEGLPSKEAAFKFQATVNLSYKLTKPDELPYDSLDEAEKQLWPKLRGKLRGVCRKFDLTRIADAEAEMQAELEQAVDEGVEGFGLKVVSAQVDVDLEEAARNRYVELAQIQHAAALKEAELKGLIHNQGFYQELIQKGDWAVLGVAMLKGEIGVREVADRLSRQEAERLAMQIDLLKSLRADNAKDESQDWTISQELLKAVAGKVMQSTTPSPALAAGEAPAQLPTSKPTEASST